MKCGPDNPDCTTRRAHSCVREEVVKANPSAAHVETFSKHVEQRQHQLCAKRRRQISEPDAHISTHIHTQPTISYNSVRSHLKKQEDLQALPLAQQLQRRHRRQRAFCQAQPRQISRGISKISQGSARITMNQMISPPTGSYRSLSLKSPQWTT